VTFLLIGLVLFFAPHSVRLFADGFRTAGIERIGLTPWKGLYALVSIAGFVLIVWGYGLARADPVVLYSPPLWTRALTGVLTIPAFILLAAAYVPGTHIKRAVGHPMVAGTKVWAFAHLLSNGTLADVLLFGAFIVWAVLDYTSLRRRDRAAGKVYVAGPVARDFVAIVAGLVLWAVFAFWLHGPLIGVRVFG
jgi:uncharacterized membrane protein